MKVTLCNVKEKFVSFIYTNNFISQNTPIVTNAYFQSFSRMCFHCYQKYVIG